MYSKRTRTSIQRIFLQSQRQRDRHTLFLKSLHREKEKKKKKRQVVNAIRMPL